MTESVSSFVGGNLPTDTKTLLPGPLPGGLTVESDESEVSDFAAVFGGMSFADRQDDSTSLLNPLGINVNPPEAANDRLAGDEGKVQPITPQIGNTLPITTEPELALPMPITGFKVHANQDTVAAFQSDDRSMLSTAPVQTANPAIAQQIPAQKTMLENELESFTRPKVDLSNQVEMLAKTQQTTAPLETIALSSSQHSTQVLSGLQGVSEFSNVLAASRVSAEPLTATPNQTHWNQQVGDRISWMISQGLRQAEIRLNPPELGMLEVRVQVNGDQTNIQFNTAHAEVKDALDAALPRLREMLAESGLNLGDVNVSQHGQQQAKSEESPQSKNTEDTESEPAPAIAATSATSNGLIDFYA